MRPIPGNIVCIGVMHIAGCWLRAIADGFAIRWPVEALVARPKGPYIVSPVMPKRVGDRRTGNRMRRSKPSAMRRSRPCERLVRGKHKRYYAERRDQRPIHSIRHGTHQFVGYWAARQRTLGPAFRARKRTVNCWLKRNINSRRFQVTCVRTVHPPRRRSGHPDHRRPGDGEHHRRRDDGLDGRRRHCRCCWRRRAPPRRFRPVTPDAGAC